MYGGDKGGALIIGRVDVVGAVLVEMELLDTIVIGGIVIGARISVGLAVLVVFAGVRGSWQGLIIIFIRIY